MSGSDTLHVVRHGGYLHVAGLSFRWDYILIYTLLRFLQGGGFGKLLLSSTIIVL